jgi:hypothetical protein
MSENAILGHCHRSLFFSIAISVTQARLAMPCIASSFRSAHKPYGSCNAIKSREWLNLIYKIAGGLSCRTDNVCSWQIVLKKSFFADG